MVSTRSAIRSALGLQEGWNRSPSLFRRRRGAVGRWRSRKTSLQSEGWVLKLVYLIPRDQVYQPSV